MGSRSKGGTNATMAAPAWRQFSFFGSTQYPSSTASRDSSPEIVQHPHLISTIHSNPSLTDDGILLLADLEGNLSWINEEWNVEKTWKVYEGGRCGYVESKSWDRKRGRIIVITVGDDESTPFPLLKVWLLALPSTSTSSTVPPMPSLTLLRQSPISPSPNRPSPVSSLAVSPSLSHIVVGLTDGNVVGFKRVDELIETSLVELNAINRAVEQASSSSTGTGTSSSKAKDRIPQFVVTGLGKLRTFSRGNKEPITNIGIASSPTSDSSTSVPTLFILTTSEILALPLPPSHVPSSRYKNATPTVLDDLGAAVGCARIMRLGSGHGMGGAEGEGGIETAERMVVAREEAIYVYGSEGREGCWAYEGPKSAIYALQSSSTSTSAAGSTASSSMIPAASSSSAASVVLPTPYLAIVTPPQRSSLSSQSATIRNHASRANTGPSSTPPTRIGGPPTTTTNPGEELVSKVTIFDPENKFVAFSKAFGDVGSSEGGGIREIVEAWNAVWVLTDSGKLYRLTEQPLQSSLVTLYQRNLYTLAIGLAKSRGLGQSEVGEIYRRYGDHLYSKGDFEGSMNCYLKTVGTVQASYVIRKFLDAQRLTHLTSYLQELHSRNLANSDITTLLLNCYTKLADDEALSRFIHSSSRSTSPSRRANGAGSTDGDEGDDPPPFDLETAIRVLRQASYFSHAIWLAERYRLHSEYLRISIEDTSDYLGALSYVGDLARSEKKEEREEAENSMKRWGGVLLKWEPRETTKILVEIVCGVEKKPKAVEEASREGEGNRSNGTTDPKEKKRSMGGGYDVPNSTSQPRKDSSSPARTASPEPTEPLPSPRQFFAHFVDHPREFVSFLESVASRRYKKSLDDLKSPKRGSGGVSDPLPTPRTLGTFEYGDAETRDEQAIWNTLLELYVSPLPSKGQDAMEDEREGVQLRTKAIRMLQNREEVPYDETQALLVCTTMGFVDGFVLLYELLGMYEDIVRYWIDASTASPDNTLYSSRIVTSLHRYGPVCPALYRTVLCYLTTTSSLLSRHQTDLLSILDEIDEQKVMPPIEVIQILSKNGTASIGLVRDFLKKQLLAEKQEIDSDQALIASYRTESAKKQKEIRELSDPQAPRIFQVTRCSACGGQLDLPGVHFMCRHSYHQRCLGENESQCPNCARTHGVVREIRRTNEQLANRSDLFVQEVRESGPGESFGVVASAFGKGWMGMTSSQG